MVCDSTIAISLTWHLVCSLSTSLISDYQRFCWQRRHKTGFTDTDDILNKIIKRECQMSPYVPIFHGIAFDIGTVQNGLITAIFSIVHLITFLTDVRLLFVFLLLPLIGPLSLDYWPVRLDPAVTL